MSFYKRKSTLFILGLLLILGAVPPVWAQMALSPTILELKAYPGGFQTFFLSVSNNGKTPLRCTVSVSAMDVMGSGLPVAVENSPRSAKDWITLEPAEFELAPSSGKRIVGRIRPPRGTVGGYYALISVLGVPRGAARDGQEGAKGLKAGVRFLHRVQAVVLMTVPGSKIKAIIEPGEPFIQLFEQGAGYTINVPIRNRGNIHDRIKGVLDIKSEAGQMVERFELAAGRGFILPKQERVFTSKGTINLPDGIYSAGIRLNRSSGGPMRTFFPFAVKGGKPELVEITDKLRRELMNQSTGFLIVPAQLSLNLKGGERRLKPVELRNLTRKPIRIQARVMEWQRNDLGFDLVKNESAEHGHSASDWLSLRITEFELAPLGRRQVPLSIHLPKSAEGEGYAAVTFSRSGTQLDESPKGLAKRSVLVQVGARGTARPNADIEKIWVIKQSNGTYNLLAGIRNTGNIGYVPDISFKLIDKFNNDLGRKKPINKSGLIQAGGTGLLEANWSEVLPPGEYTMEVVLRYDPNSPPAIKRKKINIGE